MSELAPREQLEQIDPDWRDHFLHPEQGIDFYSNGDSGRWVKLMADIESEEDDEPRIVYHSHGPALSTILADLRLEAPRTHGLAQQHMRYCACCDDWKMAGAVKCSECGAEWEQRL